ncbi:MAG: hypothetical protein ACTHW7_09115, partial [Actinomycetaceae bacterium]
MLVPPIVADRRIVGSAAVRPARVAVQDSSKRHRGMPRSPDLLRASADAVDEHGGELGEAVAH